MSTVLAIPSPKYFMFIPSYWSLSIFSKFTEVISLSLAQTPHCWHKHVTSLFFENVSQFIPFLCFMPFLFFFTLTGWNSNWWSWVTPLPFVIMLCMMMSLLILLIWTFVLSCFPTLSVLARVSSLDFPYCDLFFLIYADKIWHCSSILPIH